MQRVNSVFLIELLLALVIKAIPLIHLPLDWFQTFFHELSHGLAALVTGGRIHQIQIAFDTSGSCLTSGGWLPMVLFSGYAGSALWGSLIYLSVSARQAKNIALSLGLLVALAGLLWVRDWVTPWILLTIVAMFLLAYRYGKRKWTHRFVAFVGLYVLVESLRSPFHLLDGRDLGDGAGLARLTYLPELFWIAVWALIAVGLIVLLYRRTTN
ncbi:MAG: M50 family metallopeptidase [Candidatus Thiodiazotropha sp.]